MCAAAEVYYQNSCQSNFSGVHLVLEVFQDILHSNKENFSVFYNAAQSCPLMASNCANWYLVRISFRSRSGADHSLHFLGWWFPISFTGVHLVLKEFQIKVAHFCFCHVRMEMPLLMYFQRRNIRRLFMIGDPYEVAATNGVQ